MKSTCEVAATDFFPNKIIRSYVDTILSVLLRPLDFRNCCLLTDK